MKTAPVIPLSALLYKRASMTVFMQRKNGRVVKKVIHSLEA